MDVMVSLEQELQKSERRDLSSVTFLIRSQDTVDTIIRRDNNMFIVQHFTILCHGY